MGKRPVPAKSELEVARIVWGLGSATVRQVLDAMPEGRDVDFKTVQTYLRRLKAKGYLRTRREGRTLVYSPRVHPNRVIGAVVDDLMNRPHVDAMRLERSSKPSSTTATAVSSHEVSMPSVITPSAPPRAAPRRGPPGGGRRPPCGRRRST